MGNAGPQSTSEREVRFAHLAILRAQEINLESVGGDRGL